MPYKDPIIRREKNRQYGRKYRSKPGIREKRIQYRKEWGRINTDHVREYQADWHRRNPNYDKIHYPEHRQQRDASCRKYMNNTHDKTLQCATNHCRNWDGSEEYFLLSNRSLMSIPELAFELGRTNYSILHKLLRLRDTMPATK